MFSCRRCCVRKCSREQARVISQLERGRQPERVPTAYLLSKCQKRPTREGGLGDGSSDYQGVFFFFCFANTRSQPRILGLMCQKFNTFTQVLKIARGESGRMTGSRARFFFLFWWHNRRSGTCGSGNITPPWQRKRARAFIRNETPQWGVQEGRLYDNGCRTHSTERKKERERARARERAHARER